MLTWLPVALYKYSAPSGCTYDLQPPPPINQGHDLYGSSCTFLGYLSDVLTRWRSASCVLEVDRTCEMYLWKAIHQDLPLLQWRTHTRGRLMYRDTSPGVNGTKEV
jgi:hypothetical protein